MEYRKSIATYVSVYEMRTYIQCTDAMGDADGTMSYRVYR